MISNIAPHNINIKNKNQIPSGYKQTYYPQKSYDYDSINLNKKDNISFCGYQNALKINPYELLKNENTAKALEDYIRNGMFIHIPPVDGKKGGDAFWDLFMGLKNKFQNCPDTDEVYTELRKTAEEQWPVSALHEAALKQVSERAEVLGQNVKNMLAENGITIKPDSRYLDVGCGDGKVALSISQELNIPEQNVNGLEIIERDDLNYIQRYKFNGEEIPEKFNDSDFVTLFNVLHHTKDEKTAKKLLTSVHERMKDGGILMIRDHNACSPEDVKFWQVRHLLPIKVSKVDPPCLVEDTVYHSMDEWTDMLKEIGFKPLFSKKDKQFNDIYSFYLGLQK